MLGLERYKLLSASREVLKGFFHVSTWKESSAQYKNHPLAYQLCRILKLRVCPVSTIFSINCSFLNSINKMSAAQYKLNRFDFRVCPVVWTRTSQLQNYSEHVYTFCRYYKACSSSIFLAIIVEGVIFYVMLCVFEISAFASTRFDFATFIRRGFKIHESWWFWLLWRRGEFEKRKEWCCEVGVWNDLNKTCVVKKILKKLNHTTQRTIAEN